MICLSLEPLRSKIGTYGSETPRRRHFVNSIFQCSTEALFDVLRVGHLKKVLPAQSENVFIVGHSVGNQAILRYLSEIDDNVVGKYGGVLHVAGWFFVDKEKEWPTLLPWLAPFDTDRASKRANNFHLVISDNDQFTSDYQGTKKAFEDHVGAKVQVIPGAKHFNEAIEPTVQSLILSMLFG